MKIKRVYIEITNRCNLRCSFCTPHHRPYQDMSIDNFKKIIDEVKSITSYIYLHVHGEPLCHPEINEFLDYCDQEEMKVQLVTNASLLSMHPNLLQHSSIRKLFLSLHSVKFHPDKSHITSNDIIQWIDKIQEKENRYLELRFWVNDSSSLLLKALKSQFEFIPTAHSSKFKIHSQCFVHFDQQFEWPKDAQGIKTTGTCLGGKNMIAILVDGTVTPCCLDCSGDINLGNIFSSSLDTLLKNKRYFNFIHHLSQNKFVEQLCQKCTYKNRFD